MGCGDQLQDESVPVSTRTQAELPFSGFAWRDNVSRMAEGRLGKADLDPAPHSLTDAPLLALYSKTMAGKKSYLPLRAGGWLGREAEGQPLEARLTWGQEIAS